uniref:DUF4371 domain-containing protein n=1 Tax=Oryza glaberrima TaxID=4538 RepID=I1Q276_ORYGL
MRRRDAASSREGGIWARCKGRQQQAAALQQVVKMPKRTLLTYYSSLSNTNTNDPPLNNEIASQSKRPRAEFSHMDIIGDPVEWKPIENYQPEIRDQVKRIYALSGPTQPDICTFPRKWQSGEWRKKCKDFMNQRTSIFRKIEIVSKEEDIRYKIRLTSSLDVIRFLIEQGDPFRGQDKTNASLNKGKFREMVNWYKDKVP